MPISLNFKGQETFQTIPGGILSILALILLIAFTGLKAKRLILREDWWLNS